MKNLVTFFCFVGFIVLFIVCASAPEVPKTTITIEDLILYWITLFILFLIEIKIKSPCKKKFHVEIEKLKNMRKQMQQKLQRLVTKK
ncbi:MAG: hypothetical protein E7063_03575 [Spirochaetaceae bacterium]|nr:hypothetical protein [Spirochaetaceae bacterium]